MPSGQVWPLPQSGQQSFEASPMMSWHTTGVAGGERGRAVGHIGAAVRHAGPRASDRDAELVGRAHQRRVEGDAVAIARGGVAGRDVEGGAIGPALGCDSMRPASSAILGRDSMRLARSSP